jgi:hypothetical protein
MTGGVMATSEPKPVQQGTTAGKPRELALSAAWHGALVPSLTTIDGERIEVVFAGHWTHGFGPDFDQAMLSFADGTLRTGAVEIHQRTSDWIAHRHHLDPRYNDVILHVVARHDGAETRQADGALVPVGILPVSDEQLRQIDQRLPGIWEQLGGAVCAERLAREQPGMVRAILHRLGDERLAQRVAIYESDLTREAAPETLHRSWFDALGFAENRAPMRALAGLLPPGTLSSLTEAPAELERRTRAAALLLGAGGFLPLSPADAAHARLSPDAVGAIESAWVTLHHQTPSSLLAPTIWQRGRVRPANHPTLRLVQAATVIARTHGDLLPLVLETLRLGRSLPEAIQEASLGDAHPPIGEDRAIAIAATVFIPFAIAYASHTEDDVLLDEASDAWERLPAAGRSRPVKRALRQVAGDARLTGLGERGNQGLLHLDRTLCTPRRCFECPVARAVVAAEIDD